jgi:transitional endoplasmic reticulum ATPase
MTMGSTAAIAAYVHAMMGAFEPGSAPGWKLSEWLSESGHGVGVDFAAATRLTSPSDRQHEPPAKDPVLAQASWEQLRAALAATIATPAACDIAAANVAAFAQAVGLDGIDGDLFRLVFHSHHDAGFGMLCGNLVSTRRIDSLGLCAIALGHAPAELMSRLRRGPLRALNLVSSIRNSFGRFALFVPQRIVDALLPPGDGLADIEEQLIGAPLRPQLALDDFAHVATVRDFVLRLLAGAVQGKHKGINVLLHGLPGRGKTEFCKMAAAHLDCDLFAVGEVDEFGDEPSRSDRIDALRLADKLARRRGNVILLFDEMEDILQHGEESRAIGRRVRRSGSKVFFNRLLEENVVPVLWTANALDEFDPAFLRRMTFVLEMKTLPLAARARLWEGLAQRQGLSLTREAAAGLARRHKVAPSLMSGAARSVALAGGTAGDIDFVVRALAQPLGTIGREDAGGACFEPALTNAESDLADLEAALMRQGAPRDFSLCLHGPPGTGKSAFARHLAGAIGLTPLVKRGSDLLSRWVGETEQRIAKAFDEARRDEYFLIIDEVEAFLWSRAGAQRSWEVSMVNELLVAMETHPLPFACTTNHLAMIDAAALRRFTFKVKFDFMTAAQSAAAYRRFFGREPPPALRDITALTPGDFAAAAKQLRFLDAGELRDAAVLALLEREVAAKNSPTRRIGF